jgi:uroporphyrinogen decarboxylase
LNDLFLRACRRQRVERTPLWIMRQAGRYLPEYRELRQRVDFRTLYRTPELAARATLQPLERFALDAAIVFSDILVPAEAMGLAVAFEPGPVLARPVRTRADVERLATPDPEEAVPFVYETLRLLRRELHDRVPLIGFAAAPLTLAAYLVQGQGARGFERFRQLLHEDPQTLHRLLDRVGRVTERYLAAQVQAGAQALQLFDTWAGLLGRADYREFGLRHARRVLEALRGTGVPLIYFALDASHLLEEIGESGADVIGVDWRVDLDEASRRLGGGLVLQGNLDPAVLLAGTEATARQARAILAAGAGLPGHVFNLGHGVLPETPLESVEALVSTVRDFRPG